MTITPNCNLIECLSDMVKDSVLGWKEFYGRLVMVETKQYIRSSKL